MNREKLAAFVTKAASFGCAKTVTLMWLAEDCKSFFQKVSRRCGPACGGVWAFPLGWGKDSGTGLCGVRVATVAAVWQKVKARAIRMELPWLDGFMLLKRF